MSPRQMLRRLALALVRVLFALPIVGARLKRDSGFEHAMCRLVVRGRMQLPTKTLDELFPGAADEPVQLRRLPDGNWASPINDVLHLLKIERVRRPMRVLELGSFRGWTAAYLADNLPPGGRVVAVDIDPAHGVFYKDTPLASRIERRVGAIRPELFAPDGADSYDLIFVDADHRYPSVRNDTEIALNLVARDGLIAWHDYANYGYFNGGCGVPEYLGELARSRAVVHLKSTNLALYSPAWDRVSAAPAAARAVPATSA